MSMTINNKSLSEWRIVLENDNGKECKISFNELKEILNSSKSQKESKK